MISFTHKLVTACLLQLTGYRYVLFEETPFGGSLSVAKEHKQLETLKPDIDIAFAKRYRPSSEGRGQEKFDASSQKWVPTDSASQHALRFLM